MGHKPERREMMAKRYHVALLTTCLLLLAGCSGGRQQPLEGTVTLDGKPLGEGSISFVPLPGTGGPTTGASIAAGRFYVPAEKGTFAGNFRVEITARQKTGRQILSDTAGGLVEQYEQFLPPRYNRESQLTANVTQGSNQFEFKLTSQ
jgi:hypothetical protein